MECLLFIQNIQFVIQNWSLTTTKLVVNINKTVCLCKCNLNMVLLQCYSFVPKKFAKYNNDW